ncbi:hypothetical protein [Parafrankia sp. EUN1f]|uniref:hypothetical protein n=1 Tax=Parafrankia sp. EUN1f TaxID=102897 RepID=UPI0001C43EBF|nr:hypothetical protein [Parafrankia sp. EUN1f]EFC84234.1 hypothetical protein FrEUN1fDRAFT_2651 [Parafrankia sp. EUN1f]
MWIAHLLAIMDVEARLCAPFGGEAGAVLPTLVRRSGIVARPVTVSGENGGYVHDRRAERREVVATTPQPRLSATSQTRRLLPPTHPRR